jgi:hypothetical protein
VADQLYVSWRLRGFNEATMARLFAELLRAFPFSKLAAAGPALHVHAVSEHEPAVFEQAYLREQGLEPLVEGLNQFLSPDSVAIVDATWDLWQYDREWKLRPTRVALLCFGPHFEHDSDDHMRLELGIDTHFLPQPELPNYLFMAQSNIRSLLHLIEDLDAVLPIERRRLWSESGENFAARLAGILNETKPGQRLV